MSVGTNVVFNGNSFQNGSSIVTGDIDHHSAPEFNLKVINMAHANAVATPYRDFPKKVIPHTGDLIASSISALDTLEDTFKSYLTAQNVNLDIDFAGGTRRYLVGSVSKIAIMRPGGRLKAGYSVEYICQPFGMDTSSTSLFSTGAITANSDTETPTFGGTAPFQYPIITVTVGSLTTSATNLVTNPGFETNLSGWSSGGIGTATQVATQHHSGSGAMQMVNAASSPLSVPSANTYGWELYNLSGLTTSTTYTVSAWVKGNAGGETFKMSTLLSAVQTVTLTTSWQLVTFTFVASGTTDQIYVWSTTASATWFLDDVSVLSDGSGTISVGNGNNNQGINVTRVWLPGDVLTVDMTQLLNTPGISQPVQVNGLPVLWSGGLPEFAPGAAIMYYNDTFLTRSITWSAVNTNRYL